MAVTVDATATSAVTSSSAVATLTNSNLTVGVGATALLAWLSFDELAITVSSGTITVKWDNAGTPQAMTLIAEQGNPNTHILLYGLVNPTSGNKNLTAAWTNAVPCVLMGESYNGTFSSSAATTFLHSTINNGTSGSPTLTVTGAVGNITAASMGAINAITSYTATSSTSEFNFTSPNTFGLAGARAPGAASLVWTGAPTSTEWCTIGIDIAASLLGPPFKNWVRLLGPVLAQ